MLQFDLYGLDLRKKTTPSQPTIRMSWTVKLWEQDHPQ
jgi:hypothetical protein